MKTLSQKQISEFYNVSITHGVRTEIGIFDSLEDGTPTVYEFSGWGMYLEYLDDSPSIWKLYWVTDGDEAVIVEARTSAVALQTALIEMIKIKIGGLFFTVTEEEFEKSF